MLRRSRVCFLLLALVCVPLLAAQETHKSGEQAHEKASNDIYWKWANFAVLAGALGYFIYKKSGAVFHSRTQGIRKSIEEADRLRREADQRLAEIERRLNGLEAEIEGLGANARAEMAAENERLRQETAAGLEKLRRQAESELAGVVLAARKEVQAHAAALAVELAAVKIRALMTPRADDALITSVLDTLEKTSRTSPKELN